jgi:hypothetical protein
MQKYKIQKSKTDITGHHLKKYPFDEMEVGDFITPENINSCYVSALFFSKKHHNGLIKFSVRNGNLHRIK